MNRDIEFRGYDGMDWIYGTSINHDKETNTWYMVEHGAPEDDWVMVGEIGQFTGLKDKKGKKIYEDDYIVNDRGTLLTVTFVDGAFYAEGTDVLSGTHVFSNLSDFSSWSEVNGNNHDDQRD